MGYWQNFNNGAPVLTIAQVPTTYDIIAVAFANSTGVPGQISFAIDPGVTGYTDAQFKADIVTAHGRGQKVVLSIGGQNGSISVSDSASATAFANSAAAILTNYGFDGIDIDLENGINPSSMASAISQLVAMKPGALVTAAPQTLDTQNSQSSYFSFASMIGANMTMMNTQYYNSGSMLGCDGGVYSEGNENFVTALACTQLNGLPASEIGIGFPATSAAAGSGYVSPSVVVAALQCLANGSNCGTFRPPANHPTIRGVMTWSINWDASNGYQFANTVSPALRALP
jgi:chitinase